MGWELEPEGESLRRAVQWIGERRRVDPTVQLARLVDEAGLRFDLSPMDEEFLWRTLVTAPDHPAEEL